MFASKYYFFDTTFEKGYASNNNLVYYNEARDRININNINLIKINKSIYTINFLIPQNINSIG